LNHRWHGLGDNINNSVYRGHKEWLVLKDFRRAKPAHFAFCNLIFAICIVRRSLAFVFNPRPVFFTKAVLSLFVILLFSGCIPRGVEVPVDVRRFQESQADSLMALGRYWEAVGFYRHAWMLSGTDEERAEISAKLYRVFYDAREWDSCVVWAETLRGTPWFDSLSYKGLVYWRAGRFEDILGMAAASPLLCAEAASRLGLDDSAQLLYSEAERLLGEVVRGRRAEIYAELGKKDSAVVLLRKMTYPSNSQRRLLVELMFEQADWVRLPSAIARLPNESERLAALVRLYDAVGDQKKKRRTQMKLIREYPRSWTAQQAARGIEPQNADELFSVAKAYAGIDADKAIDLFDEAESKGYSRSSCRWELAQLYYSKKEYEKASQELEGFKSTEAKFLYVKAILKLGKSSDALQILKEVAATASSKSERQEAWERMATILQEQGKNREAALIAAE
jgi:tetratricopeptide (TPR) repeat protein